MGPEALSQWGGWAALAFLIVSFALMARSVRIGRRLMKVVEERYPDLYEKLGRPRPGFFMSQRRFQFERFVAQRAYTVLDDPDLVEAFDRLRDFQRRVLVFTLVGLAIAGGILVWIYWGPGRG